MYLSKGVKQLYGKMLLERRANGQGGGGEIKTLQLVLQLILLVMCSIYYMC